MKTLIIEIQYFAPVDLYFALINSKYCSFEQYETWQKMSFRNRCMVAGAGGPIELSIPVENGREQRAMIKDVKIAERENWRVRHWRTIESCYNKSPWFEFHRDGLENLYARPEKFLFDWNLKCFEWVMSRLKISTPFGFTEEYQKEYPEKEFLDLRNKITPKTIRLANKPFPKWEGKYIQVFENKTGFIPHLSVLDFLFCEGNSGELMQKN